MKYIIIGVFIILTIIVIGMILRFKQKNKEISLASEFSKYKEESSLIAQQNDSLVIKFDMLPAEMINESSLVEITDNEVLARINNLVPNLAQAGNAVNNVVQDVAAQGEVLYRAIIPSGAKLAKSKEMNDAVRGIYHSADGIRGHANLIAVNNQKGASIVANSTAAAMGVASVVVGQYYMTQINAELEQINGGISKISDFQDNEYRSRVFALISHVKRITEFQVEILENDELRISKIAQLDSLEEECTKLLGQANLSLVGFVKKNNIDFMDYEKEVQEAHNWYIYQNTLLEVMYKISDLRFALHLGAVTREQCGALLITYTQQVEETQSRLKEWHNESIYRLNIDTTEIRRKRGGWDKAIHFIPGLINDNWNFRPISENTASMIDAQIGGHSELNYNKTDFYFEDVQLICKDGKLYYLPPHQE